MRTRSLYRMMVPLLVLAGLPVSACTLLVKTNQPPWVCGDDVAEGAEACDGADLRGKTCGSLGLGSGELTCLQDCTLDPTGCTGVDLCGNGQKEPEEACDGADLGGQTCNGVLPGSSGNLACRSDCTFDMTGCDAVSACGNGQLDPGEQCDGTLGVHPCISYGFAASPGSPGCDGFCLLDFSRCEATPFTGFASVTTGARHSCGIKEDATVWCWGDNQFGQLGVGVQSGFPDYRVVPVQVFLGDEEPLMADQIGAGHAHTCAMELHVSGVTQRLFCWGDNQYGQLGDGTFLSSSTPVAVMYQNVQQGPLAVGHDHNCYFPWEAPRTVHCWGRNDSGQLGNGSTGNQPTPGLLYNPVNLQYKEIAAGGQHTCGVTESNDVYCWGNNGRGQLGTGDMTQKTTPAVVEVPDLSENNVLSITAGGEHTCAVFSPSADYRLYCWGANSHSQLGLTGVTSQSTPAQVVTSVNAVKVVAGRHSTCVMNASYHMTCWGKNSSGQLGLGSTDAVTEPGTFITMGFSQLLLPVRDMDMGDTHGCAVEQANGPRIFCWGENGFGQLGLGNLLDSWFSAIVNR